MINLSGKAMRQQNICMPVHKLATVELAKSDHQQMLDGVEPHHKNQLLPVCCPGQEANKNGYQGVLEWPRLHLCTSKS